MVVVFLIENKQMYEIIIFVAEHSIEIHFANYNICLEAGTEQRSTTIMEFARKLWKDSGYV